MKTVDRIALYAALLLGICAVLFNGVVDSSARAREAASDVPPRIAVCSVIRITDELMETDRFKPDRMEFEDELRKERLTPLLEQGRALREKLEGLKPEDPDFNELRDNYRRLQAEAQRATTEIMQKVEQKVAEQLVECYQLVRTSAIAVAEDQGYNFVLSSTDAEDKLRSETVMRLVRDLLARPVIMAPREVDITEDVRQDLKLE